jgi:hypothetical protein
MASSLFYRERFDLFPVTPLAIEFYSQRLGDLDDEGMLKLLADSIKLCGVSDEPTEVHLEHFVACLVELSKGSDEAKEPAKRSSKRSLGTEYAKFLQELQTTSILGMMTHYNKESMRKLYCETDIREVRKLVDVYIRHLMETNNIRYEASLYGAGNSFKDDDPNVHVMDATTKEGRAAMAQFGIGSISAEGLDLLGLGVVKS